MHYNTIRETPHSLCHLFFNLFEFYPTNASDVLIMFCVWATVMLRWKLFNFENTVQVNFMPIIFPKQYFNVFLSIRMVYAPSSFV